jgi:hypothetical protein
MSVVPAIGELCNVLPSVFGRDVNVRSSHGSFEKRPMSFKGVGVMDAAHPFVGRMINATVDKPAFGQRVIAQHSSVLIVEPGATFWVTM